MWLLLESWWTLLASNICVAVVTSFLSFKASSHVNIEKERFLIQKESYFKAYVPFIQNLYVTRVHNKLPKKIDYTTRTKLFDLITNNLQYWNVEVSQLYPDLYLAYVHMLDFDALSDVLSRGTSKKDFSVAISQLEEIEPTKATKFNKLLNKVILAILEEAYKKEQLLGLPLLAKPLLDNYQNSNCKPRKNLRK